MKPVNNDPYKFTIEHSCPQARGGDLSFTLGYDGFDTGIQICNIGDWSFEVCNNGCGITIQGIHVIHIVATKTPDQKAPAKGIPDVSVPSYINVLNIKIFGKNNNVMQLLSSAIIVKDCLPIRSRRTAFTAYVPKNK